MNFSFGEVPLGSKPQVKGKGENNMESSSSSSVSKMLQGSAHRSSKEVRQLSGLVLSLL